MKVAIHFEPGSSRSKMLARAMSYGVEEAGDHGRLISGFDIQEPLWGDVVVAYGWRWPELFWAYRFSGRHFVYLDLGWWERKPPGAINEGFHKVVVDGREPNDYFRRCSSPDRFSRFGLTVAPWRQDGAHVLLAGMSAKSAGTRGYGPQQWELAMVQNLREITAREIVYRPKPSWLEAKPIPGTAFSPPQVPIERALANAWAVVTLHSNVAVDALLAGIPIHCQEGVALPFSTHLDMIDRPFSPTTPISARENLMADIAYCQWSVPELADGTCWRHLKKETPLCA